MSRRLRASVLVTLPIMTSMGSLLVVASVVFTSTLKCANASRRTRRPNFIFIFADDLGYGDLSVYGHPTQERGFLDQMAADGLRFTQWYSASVFCTPSRAALLTGRLPVRSGMTGGHVLMPKHPGGLPHGEITLAEALKDRGYATGIVGKWHLGINSAHRADGRFLPHAHGFDFVGTILPFTLSWNCDENKDVFPSTDCFLYRNTTIIQQPINLDNLTATFLHDAKSFIYERADQPFFLYLPLAQTHTPMFNDPKFKGRSKRGAFGDQVNEMSWMVEEIVNTLHELSLQNDTLVFFVSDHGPHSEMCLEGGSSGMFRGGKGNFYEGGLRVPAIAWWPGTIAANRLSSDVISTMDIFTTFIDLAGGQIPRDRVIDGRSFTHILMDEANTGSLHECLFFYDGFEDVITAVRYKRYKVHLYIAGESSYYNYTRYCHDGIPTMDYYVPIHGDTLPLQKRVIIFDVESDPAERFPLRLDTHGWLLDTVNELLDKHKRAVEKSARILSRSKIVRSLQPCCNPPYCHCNYRKNTL